jgi:hypothetical protein
MVEHGYTIQQGMLCLAEHLALAIQENVPQLNLSRISSSTIMGARR